MASAQNIIATMKAEWNKIKDETLGSDVLKSAIKVAALTQIDIIRKRIFAKVDRSGKRFPKPSKNWAKRKNAILSGRAKSPGFRRQKTTFVAKSAADIGRFSGRTMADLTYKSPLIKRNSDGVILTWGIGFKTKRSEDVAGYLEEKGIDAYGPARPGTGIEKRENTIIAKAIADFLRTKKASDISVSDRNT